MDETQVKDEYLSTEEAAELLGVSIWTLRRYCREGKLDVIRVGGERAPWRINVKNFRK